MTQEELRTFLAESRARLLATVEAAPTELLTRRPAPERWSPLEVVEHVALAEEWFVQIVGGLVEEGRQKGLRYTAGTPRNMDALAALNEQVDLRKPMKAAEFVEPTGSASLTDLRDRLERSRQGLLDLFPALDELDTDQLKCRHLTQPFELNAYQWAHLSGLHDRQHTRQIRQALEALS